MSAGPVPGSTGGCRRASLDPDARRSVPLLAAARRCRHDQRRGGQPPRDPRQWRRGRGPGQRAGPGHRRVRSDRNHRCWDRPGPAHPPSASCDYVGSRPGTGRRPPEAHSRAESGLPSGARETLRVPYCERPWITFGRRDRQQRGPGSSPGAGVAVRPSGTGLGGSPRAMWVNLLGVHYPTDFARRGRSHDHGHGFGRTRVRRTDISVRRTDINGRGAHAVHDPPG
jgi:hypothetical protein